MSDVLESGQALRPDQELEQQASVVERWSNGDHKTTDDY
jgi:hypothetical protein